MAVHPASSLSQEIASGIARVRRRMIAEADRRLERVLTSDPGMGVLRHVDAGYDAAVKCAEERGVRVPGLNY